MQQLNSFRPTFWAEDHTDSFLAVATHMNVSSCNLQYNIICVGQ